MKMNNYHKFILSIIITILCSNLVTAQRRTRSEPETQTSQVLETGFVLYEGQYIPPPYVLSWQNNVLTLNDLPIQAPRLGRMGRRPISERGNGQRVFPALPPQRAASWLLRRLSQDCVFICWADQPSVFLLPHLTLDVLKTLFSDMSPEDKTNALIELDENAASPAQWEIIAERFVQDPALKEQLESMQANYEARIAESEAEEDWASDDLISGLTVSGFILAVIALGMLMKANYPGQLQDDPHASKQVMYLVLLMVSLNIYDLICTLLAHNLGGLWELNPFASNMMDQSMMVIIYKLGLTVGAALLLIVARHYRIAQLTTYWASVLYTVLILRWISYNSMFMM